MRTAYFVQTHRDPEQVDRLLATLRRGSPGALLLVGHDPSAPPLPDGILARSGVRLFRPSQAVRRGYWSTLLPYLEAVEHLERSGEDYDWLAYLSGQDYPAQPLAATEAELAASPFDGFLQFREAAARSTEGRRRQGVLRYDYRYHEVRRLAGLLRVLRALNGVQRLCHVHLTYGPRLGVRLRRPPAREGVTVWQGSQWTTLRRSCAERVAAAARPGSPWLRRFEHTICPDEAFVQTVLLADGSFRLCNDHRRYIDFRGSRDGRPRTLGMADAPTLAAGAYHFARKFDPTVDTGILDWLDTRLLAGAVAAPG